MGDIGKLATKAADRLSEDSLTLFASAESFAISNDTQFAASAELLRAIKGKLAELVDVRRGITRPIDEAKARVLDLFEPASLRLAAAERTIKFAMLAFTHTQERARQVAQAKIDEAARKERERLRMLAETQRERGDERRADATEERAVNVPALSVAPSTPKVAGVATRTTWRAEVTDMRALVKACAEGLAPLSFLEPNMHELGLAARTQKGALSIPGVCVVAEDIVVARSS